MSECETCKAIRSEVTFLASQWGLDTQQYYSDDPLELFKQFARDFLTISTERFEMAMSLKNNGLSHLISGDRYPVGFKSEDAI